MKAPKLRRLIERELGYKRKPGSGKGSHVKLVSEGRQEIVWAFHDQRTVAPIEIRNLLVKEVGLTLDQAKELMK